jgi:hypothetical protein
MPYTSLNLNDPVIKKSDTKIIARIGFDTDILPRSITNLPNFNVPKMNIFKARATSKNFIFIF